MSDILRPPLSQKDLGIPVRETSTPQDTANLVNQYKENIQTGHDFELHCGQILRLKQEGAFDQDPQLKDELMQTVRTDGYYLDRVNSWAHEYDQALQDPAFEDQREIMLQGIKDLWELNRFLRLDQQPDTLNEQRVRDWDMVSQDTQEIFYIYREYLVTEPLSQRDLAIPPDESSTAETVAILVNEYKENARSKGDFGLLCSQILKLQQLDAFDQRPDLKKELMQAARSDGYYLGRISTWAREYDEAFQDPIFADQKDTLAQGIKDLKELSIFLGLYEQPDINDPAKLQRWVADRDVIKKIFDKYTLREAAEASTIEDTLGNRFILPQSLWPKDGASLVSETSGVGIDHATDLVKQYKEDLQRDKSYDLDSFIQHSRKILSMRELGVFDQNPKLKKELIKYAKGDGHYLTIISGLSQEYDRLLQDQDHQNQRVALIQEVSELKELYQFLQLNRQPYTTNVRRLMQGRKEIDGIEDVFKKYLTPAAESASKLTKADLEEIPKIKLLAMVSEGLLTVKQIQQISVSPEAHDLLREHLKDQVSGASVNYLESLRRPKRGDILAVTGLVKDNRPGEIETVLRDLGRDSRETGNQNRTKRSLSETLDEQIAEGTLTYTEMVDLILASAQEAAMIIIKYSPKSQGLKITDTDLQQQGVLPMIKPKERLFGQASAIELAEADYDKRLLTQLWIVKNMLTRKLTLRAREETGLDLTTPGDIAAIYDRSLVGRHHLTDLEEQLVENLALSPTPPDAHITEDRRINQAVLALTDVSPQKHLETALVINNIESLVGSGATGRARVEIDAIKRHLGNESLSKGLIASKLSDTLRERASSSNVHGMATILRTASILGIDFHNAQYASTLQTLDQEGALSIKIINQVEEALANEDIKTAEDSLYVAEYFRRQNHPNPSYESAYQDYLSYLNELKSGGPITDPAVSNPEEQQVTDTLGNLRYSLHHNLWLDVVTGVADLGTPEAQARDDVQQELNNIRDRITQNSSDRDDLIEQFQLIFRTALASGNLTAIDKNIHIASSIGIDFKSPVYKESFQTIDKDGELSRRIVESIQVAVDTADAQTAQELLNIADILVRDDHPIDEYDFKERIISLHASLDSIKGVPTENTEAQTGPNQETINRIIFTLTRVKQLLDGAYEAMEFNDTDLIAPNLNRATELITTLDPNSLPLKTQEPYHNAIYDLAFIDLRSNGMSEDVENDLKFIRSIDAFEPTLDSLNANLIGQPNMKSINFLYEVADFIAYELEGNNLRPNDTHIDNIVRVTTALLAELQTRRSA